MARGRWWRRLLKAAAWIMVVGATLGVGAIAGLLWYYGRDLPQLITVEDYRPPRASVVLDRDGQVLARFGLERRTVVPMERIPAVMRQAIIAAEDAEFYSHKGLDYPGMLRALISVIRRGGRITQGGSTITQQLVKSLILTPERTVSRKVKEVILARRLEANLTKDEILYLYLNQIYMGHGIYGVEEASRYFFGHGVEELTVGEAALLAGVVQSPERLAPQRHEEAARARRRYVLHEMVKCGYVDQATADRVDASPLGVRAREPTRPKLAPHFIEAVRQQVRRELGQEALLDGGLRIHTTLDSRLQAAANEAVMLGLDEVDRRQKLLRVPHRSPAQAKKLLAAEVEHWGQDTPPAGRVQRGIVVRLDPEQKAYLVDLGGGYTGRLPLEALARYAQPGKGHKEAKGKGGGAAGQVLAETLFKEGDVLRVRVMSPPSEAEPQPPLQPALGPEAALIALDPETREVLALVGGDPRLPSHFDRALQARRQPGSSFKPIVYTAALGLRRRDLTLATLVDDSPTVYVGEAGKQWVPKNYDGKFRGPIRMREALAHSVNMVAIKLLQQVGVDRVIDLAHAMGIASDLDPYLSLALGASAVRPIELANAYATFAAGGRAADPLLIRRIDTPDGAPLLEVAVQPVEVIPPDLACLATDALSSVIEEGTGRKARELGRPAAGKTGTTNDQTDAWFAGYVPHLAAVVWVGNDDNFPLGRGEQGGLTALPIWLGFMKRALDGRPAEPFPPCEGLVERVIDKKSGLLAPFGHPEEESRSERFLPGTEPLEVLPLPGELDIDDFLLEQTGKAAQDGAGRSVEDGNGNAAAAATPAPPQPAQVLDPLAPPPPPPEAGEVPGEQAAPPDEAGDEQDEHPGRAPAAQPLPAPTGRDDQPVPVPRYGDEEDLPE